jgi:hypothetical protein
VTGADRGSEGTLLLLFLPVWLWIGTVALAATVSVVAGVHPLQRHHFGSASLFR